MKELTPFEKEMKAWRKKRKDEEDQIFLDNWLSDLKKKNEQGKQQQIDDLTEKLERARG